MTKKTFFYQIFFTLICLFCSQFSLLRAAEPTLGETYYATHSATLQADVFVTDPYPPSTPVLKSPDNYPTNFCNRYPIFSWTESTDNWGIQGYSFHLYGTLDSGKTFDFGRSLAPIADANNSEYNLWFENGRWFLQLRQALDFGTYHWNVAAFDEDHHSQSDTWHFNLDTNTCTFYCNRDSQLASIQFLAPQKTVSTYAPAIILSFPATVRPLFVDIYVNGQLTFSQVSLVSSHTTPLYTVIVSPETERIVIQPRQNYLAAEVSNTLRLQLTDTDNCTFSPPTHALDFTPAFCQDRAILPTLLSPIGNVAVNLDDLQFSWQIDAPLSQLQTQTFTLDSRQLFTLGQENLDNENFSYQVLDFDSYVKFQLTLKKTQLQLSGSLFTINQNNPLDLSDYHRWQIAVTGCAGHTTKNDLGRFHIFPLLQSSYSWCTDTSTCISGTLTQCLQSGRNCYYQATDTCLAQAHLDCSGNPPKKSYSWCQNQEQCTQGTLEECGQTGKNCYVSDLRDQCAQNAPTDCTLAEQYFWCTSNLTCQTGDFATCSQSGKPCFAQAFVGQACPKNAKLYCAPIAGPLTETKFGQFVDLSISLFDLLATWHLDPTFLRHLEVFCATVLPFILIFLFLPLGLIIIFFPRPRGAVVNQNDRHGVIGALVVAQTAQQFVRTSFTNKHGFYEGFKLKPGQYRLQVSHPYFLFPCKRNRSRLAQQYSYCGENFVVHTKFSPTVAPQIMLDINSNNKTPRFLTKFPLRFSLLFFRLVNFLHLLWPITFILVIILTFLYPIYLNFIILLIYCLGLTRKIYANLVHYNVAGQVFTSDGQPAVNFPLSLHFDLNHQLVANTVTDQRGQFKFLLSQKFMYQLSNPDFVFIETSGKVNQINLKFAKKKSLELLLVIKPKYSAP